MSARETETWSRELNQEEALLGLTNTEETNELARSSSTTDVSPMDQRSINELLAIYYDVQNSMNNEAEAEEWQ